MPNLSKIEPCPFCGGESISALNQMAQVVLCVKCGATGPGKCSAEAAIEAWNLPVRSVKNAQTL